MFTIIYENKPQTRAEIEKMILDAIKMGFDFEGHSVKHHVFQSLTRWPTKEELAQLSFNVQAEEVELKENRLVSIRKLITDVEEVAPDDSFVI